MMQYAFSVFLSWTWNTRKNT